MRGSFEGGTIEACRGAFCRGSKRWLISLSEVKIKSEVLNFWNSSAMKRLANWIVSINLPQIHFYIKTYLREEIISTFPYNLVMIFCFSFL